MYNLVKLYLDELLIVKDSGCIQTKNVFIHPDRCLDTCILIYVCSGQMELWEDDTEYFINEGELFFLKNGIHHWGEPKAPPGLTSYWIQFYGYLQEKNYSDINNITQFDNSYLSIDDLKYHLVLPKHFKVKSPKIIETRLSEIYELFNSKDPFKAINMSLDTIKLLLYINNMCNENSTISKSDITVKKIIRFMEEKKGLSFNSSELAQALKMNYSYLSDIFKQKTGSSIKEYYLKMRIHHAIQIMKDTNLNISEISYNLGYENPFYFSTVFKKITGMNPSDYLKQIYRSNNI